MVFYGCDIAKSSFEACGPQGRTEVKNDPSSIRTWLASIPKDAVIAMEATGGYGTSLAEIAHKSGRTVYVLAPRQVAAHRRSLGRRAKNDKMDAALIADFIQSNHDKIHPFEPWAEPWKALRDAVRLRARLARDRARIATRMRAFGCSLREIVKATRGIKETMLGLDRRIQDQLKLIPEAEAVRSPKGVGDLTAAASIAVLKQVPFQKGDAFVAFMGLDLIVSDSGKARGRRSVSSWGDATLRSLYYMAGQSAARRQEWKPYVERLKLRGMKPIQIHCAIARRLARIVYALYHSGERFDPRKIEPKPQNAPPRIASQT